MKSTKIFLAAAFSLLATFAATAQETWLGQDISNTITTAAPFLSISPDSRAGALGDAGVATSPDANSLHWNPAKFAFIEKNTGASFSYTPWLRKLKINDMNVSYVSAYKRIGKKERQTFAASLRYFTLGNIMFTDIQGNEIKDFDPHEFSIDGAYAFQLSKYLSAGIALRYIHSNLTGGLGTVDSHPGHAVSSDISTYYRRPIQIKEYDAEISWGVNASNIGSRISYTDGNVQNYIPVNLRVGAGLNLHLDDYNQIMFTCDFNKLMVPTPPIRGNNEVILYGKEDNVPVAQGVFQSFYDAPGIEKADGSRNVLQEELREINYSLGVEYLYANQIAFRTGYFHEHATKGNRKFFTLGFGMKLNVFGLDFSYLVPTNFQNSPLANTLRFTLSFDFDSLQKATTTAE